LNGQPPRSSRRTLAAILGLLVVLFLETVGGAYVLPAYRAVDLRSRAQVLATDVQALELADLNSETLAGLRLRVAALRGDIGWFRLFLVNDPVVALGDGLGLARNLKAHGALLLEAADDVTRAANIALDLADRFVALRQQPGVTGQALLGELVELMATSTAQIDEAAVLVSDARQWLAAIPDDAQSEIRKARDVMRSSLERYAPLLDQLRDLDDVVPSIVGWGEPRRYLILAQDPAELRPTGGFVGTIGIANFRDGVLVERSFRDVFELDLLPNLPFVEPPEALVNHLLGPGSWQLADANWSPDFPTSAQDALRLYTLESGDADIDGVIALTTHAVDRLLELTGPVDVPEYGVTVAAGEVTITALRLTRAPTTPADDRKAFLDDLATAVIERLYTLPPASWPALFDAFRDMGEQHSLLAWFKDPQAQRLVAASPIGGAVRQDDGDYLYVVEANVAPTSKYNLVVSRNDRLDVTLAANGDATSRLTLAWHNNALAEGEPYASIRAFSTNHSGLYGTYTRVLAPGASSLVSATGNAVDPISAVESIDSEAGRASFGTFVAIGISGADLTCVWTTAGVATQSEGVWTYRLTIQKQPGMSPVPMSVQVTLPAGAQVQGTPDGGTVSGETVTFATTLERDVQLEVLYALP
jgi:hypothetical protein